MVSKSTPRTPKTLKNTVFFRFSAIWLLAPNILQSGQDTSQNGLKLAILQSKMAILGPSWRQVGQLSAILAPTWPILAPICAPKNLQIEPQTRPNRILGHLGARRVAQELQTTPGARIFKGFTPISIPCPTPFPGIFSSSCFNLFSNFQPQVRHGGGFARAAHWIS